MYKISIKDKLSTNTEASSFADVIKILDKWRKAYGEPQVIIVTKCDEDKE